MPGTGTFTTKSQLIGKAMNDRAVGRGKVSAADVAGFVFDAIEAGRDEGMDRRAGPERQHQRQRSRPESRRHPPICENATDPACPTSRAETTAR